MHVPFQRLFVMYHLSVIMSITQLENTTVRKVKTMVKSRGSFARLVLPLASVSPTSGCITSNSHPDLELWSHGGLSRYTRWTRSTFSKHEHFGTSLLLPEASVCCASEDSLLTHGRSESLLGVKTESCNCCWITMKCQPRRAVNFLKSVSPVIFWESIAS